MSDKFNYYLKGKKGEYEVVIGLEVHAQILSESKLFHRLLLNLVRSQILKLA